MIVLSWWSTPKKQRDYRDSEGDVDRKVAGETMESGNYCVGNNYPNTAIHYPS